MAKRKQRGRPINGILLLDKPAGAGSNAVLQRVKHLYRAAKAGHTGSLDPLATGLLPICFGEATKFSRYMLDAEKAYVATVCLGAESDTGDAEGQLDNQRDASGLARADIEKAVHSFLGTQMQRPPAYSALKHKGERLYDLARRGEFVEVPEREITVYEIALLDVRVTPAQLRLGGTGAQFAVQHSAEIDVSMRVSKGTYVRSIARDIGELLGVGGYVGALRRTAVSTFSVEQSVPLGEIEAQVQHAHESGDEDRELYARLDEKLLAIDEALGHLPQVTLDEDSSFYLARGNPVQVSGAPVHGQVRIVLGSGRFLGIGEIDDHGRVAPRRLVAGGS